MKLWNRNFTYSFIGTIISAVGSIGLSLGLSVFVYSQTNSTILSAIFACLGMIPQFVLPIFVGVFIDRKHPVRVLVMNEVILSGVFLIAALYLYAFGFNYIFLMIISFIVSSLGVISQLCSSSILPKLMTVQNFNKGNSIMNMIYPLSSVAATPLIMWFINAYGVAFLFIVCTICSLIDAYIESKIDVSFTFEEKAQTKTTVHDFVSDLKEGLTYVSKTRSVRSVFVFFMAVMMLNSVQQVLMYPYFHNPGGFGDTKYALILSVNSMGYIVGGLLLVVFKIKPSRRFTISSLIFVYFVLIEGLMFSMPFSILLITQFFAGVLGAQSANFRISAILALVPDTLLGKVNALFSVMVNGSVFLSSALIGVLGESMPYATIAIIFALIQLVALIFVFLPPKNNVKHIYNYDVEAIQ